MAKTMQDRIMAGELFVEAQPDPPILPPGSFAELVSRQENTIEGIARALKELAEEGDEMAVRQLDELKARAQEFAQNRHWLWEPGCGGAYTMVEYQPILTGGFRNCLAWYLAGERFIPVWLGGQPAQAPPAARTPSPAQPPPGAGEAAAPIPTAPGAPRPGPEELELASLHCVPRPESPLPDSVWEALRGQDDLVNIYLALGRLSSQADQAARDAMGHLEQLKASQQAEPFPLVPVEQRDARWVVLENELVCLAMVAAGRKTALVLAGRPTEPGPVQKPLPIEAALPSAAAAAAAPAAEALLADLASRIAQFARTRSGLPGLAQARQLAALLEHLAASITEGLIREKLGVKKASGALTERQRYRAARIYLCEKLGISQRYCNQLVRLLSLPPAVQEEAQELTLTQLFPILKLRDETIELALVRGIIHVQAQKSKPGRPWTYPCRAVQRLVELVLEGRPIKEALVEVLDRERRPPEGTILDEMHALASHLRATIGGGQEFPTEAFWQAHKELQLALGEAVQYWKKQQQEQANCANDGGP